MCRFDPFSVKFEPFPDTGWSLPVGGFADPVIRRRVGTGSRFACQTDPVARMPNRARSHPGTIPTKCAKKRHASENSTMTRISGDRRNATGRHIASDETSTRVLGSDLLQFRRGMRRDHRIQLFHDLRLSEPPQYLHIGQWLLMSAGNGRFHFRIMSANNEMFHKSHRRNFPFKGFRPPTG
jgi:hypothetical protein